MKIEKNVEKPKRKSVGDTCRHMEIGDSVLVNNDREYNSVWQWFNRRGRKCERRTVDEGIRIWRIS